MQWDISLTRTADEASVKKVTVKTNAQLVKTVNLMFSGLAAAGAHPVGLAATNLRRAQEGDGEWKEYEADGAVARTTQYLSLIHI